MVRVFVTHNREDLDAYFGRALPNLEEIADVVLNPSDDDLSTPDLIAAAAGCEVIVAHRSTPGPAELFESSPDLLAFLRTAVDLSTVDVPAASACGVLVAHADKSFVASTAELALALTLDLARAVSESTLDYRSGDPARATHRSPASGTHGGHHRVRIDRHLPRRRRCAPSVSRSSSATRSSTPPAHGFEQVDLDTLLARSDIVYPLAPAEATTENLIDGRALDRMRRGALLVNVSRGELLDEIAVTAGARFRPARRAGDGCRPRTRPATVTRSGRPLRRRRHAPSRRTHTGERRRPVGQRGRAGAIDHRRRDAAPSRQPRVGTSAPAVVGRELNERVVTSGRVRHAHALLRRPLPDGGDIVAATSGCAVSPPTARCNGARAGTGRDRAADHVRTRQLVPARRRRAVRRRRSVRSSSSTSAPPTTSSNDSTVMGREAPDSTCSPGAPSTGRSCPTWPLASPRSAGTCNSR